MKILIVEDEAITASYLKRGLSEEGYLVEVAHEAALADEAIHLQSFDLILLDIMLPGQDGCSLCREWRNQGLTTPVLILSGRQSIGDRVQGLDAGADDYLVKPFAFEELLARMRALLRRQSALSPAYREISVRSLRLDPERKRVTLEGQTLELTAREYILLEVLARNAGRVVSRTVLWESAWESHCEPNSNVVDVYIGYLRKKMGDHADLLKTVRGSGYVLE